MMRTRLIPAVKGIKKSPFTNAIPVFANSRTKCRLNKKVIVADKYT